MSAAPTTLTQIALVVHPTRAVERAVAEVKRWAERDGVTVVQARAWAEQREVAPEGDPRESDLIVSIGGDGTTLAALRAGIESARPVLGVACGSLGVLTPVAADEIAGAIERFSTGDWIPRPIPGLDVSSNRESLLALNDVAVVRGGGGQVRMAAFADGALFVRIAGDGCVVSTPLGSSAYTLAAGGPLLMPQTDAFVVTPLPVHGGSAPPLVLPTTSIVELEVTAGYGGARLEVDGQVASTEVDRLRIGYRPAVAMLVAFADQERFLAGLRRRKIIEDSPRILAEEHEQAGD